MPYDEGLAHRIRESLKQHRGITEKKMFGGLAFMSRDYMFVGIQGDILMARVGTDAYADSLSRPHVRVMDFTGKPLRGYVFVDSPGFANDLDLSAWVQKCHRYVQSLPPKKAKA